MEVKNIRVQVVDNDRSTQSQQLLHSIEAVRTVFVRGGTIMSVWRQMLALGGISLLMSIWAVLSYKKNS